jgi:hypothetical protein
METADPMFGRSSSEMFLLYWKNNHTSRNSGQAGMADDFIESRCGKGQWVLWIDQAILGIDLEYWGLIWKYFGNLSF